jgi:hypothetical protein
MACRFEREVEPGGAVIRMSGSFDRASALELRDRIVEEPGRDLVLDFTRVNDFADLGIATLASALGGEERHLRLRGLRHHQVRMFGYFGVKVASAAVPDDAVPDGAAPDDVAPGARRTSA